MPSSSGPLSELRTLQQGIVSACLKAKHAAINLLALLCRFALGLCDTNSVLVLKLPSMWNKVKTEWVLIAEQKGEGIPPKSQNCIPLEFWPNQWAQTLEQWPVRPAMQGALQESSWGQLQQRLHPSYAPSLGLPTHPASACE